MLHLIQTINNSCMCGNYQVFKVSLFFVAQHEYFVVKGQPQVIFPNVIEPAIVYDNWELVSILLDMSIISCKVRGCNIFIFELDIQLNHFILFYWIKCHLWTVVSSWILLLETSKRHFANTDSLTCRAVATPANFKPHLMPNRCSELHTSLRATYKVIQY